MAFLTLLMCLAIICRAQDITKMSDSDSIEIGLLTCQPHNEIYSLYGHTAIRYHNLKNGEDYAFNYGIFSFKKPYFILRFLFGITDYELGVVSFDIFKKEYAHFGSMVTEQVLNLTPKEKGRLWEALKKNTLPENRVYRYNFLYNNCTTKARDIIVANIDGKINYEAPYASYPTFRQIIHSCNVKHPWAAMGNDLCMGLNADIKTTLSEQQFLPANTMHDFTNAQIYSNGSYRPLVKETRTVVPAGVQIMEKEFPLSPTECAVTLLIINIIILLYEWKQKKPLRWWDILLMTADGLAGIVILALFFSEHPTTSTNLQIFLFNPIPIIYIYSVYKGKKNYWNISLTMLICFFIGGIWQDYAEGTEILALTLLTRYWSNILNKRR